MKRFEFLFVLLVLAGSEAWLLQEMCGANWLALLPLALFVVPAILGGLDFWHFVYRTLKCRWAWIGSQSEFPSLARFVLRWLIAAVPPALVLFCLHLADPAMFTKVTSGFDAWRMAMSICIWYGFLNLPSITGSRPALSASYLIGWFKESFFPAKPLPV